MPVASPLVPCFTCNPAVRLDSWRANHPVRGQLSRNCSIWRDFQRIVAGVKGFCRCLTWCCPPCRIPLKGSAAYAEEPVAEDEIETQQVRLTGKYWLRCVLVPFLSLVMPAVSRAIAQLLFRGQHCVSHLQCDEHSASHLLHVSVTPGFCSRKASLTSVRTQHGTRRCFVMSSCPWPRGAPR